MSGALALSLVTTGASSGPGATVRSALAEEIDCYNDKDLYDLPECVERRDLDRKSGNAQSGTPLFAPGPRENGEQPVGGGEQPSGEQQQASGGQPSGSGQPAGGGQPQQQAAQSGGDEEEEEEKPAPRGPVTDPRTVALTIADAGKEATQYQDKEGTDKFGKWVQTRFERDRSNGASALGPNVMDSKVWVAKDVETAKALYKEQVAVKGSSDRFPERKEPARGTVEKIKPTKYGEEFDFDSAFYQDDKVWQHYRFVFRVGNIVSVLYLFGREEFFQDQKDRSWTGQGDWYTSVIFHRM